MDITEVPLWQWISAIWISTWGIVVYRTWSTIKRELLIRFPEHSITRQPILHMLIYVVSINFVLPIVGLPIALFDTRRDSWVKAYVKALGRQDDTHT